MRITASFRSNISKTSLLINAASIPSPSPGRELPVPLFTSVTHRVLQPDEELSESDDEIDETWVRDKHAEEVMNATREPLEFRELQIRWNDHVRSEQISSAVLLQ